MRKTKFASIMKRSEKYAAAKQTFIFYKPLTNEPSAQADSEAPQQTANIERKGE